MCLSLYGKILRAHSTLGNNPNDEDSGTQKTRRSADAPNSESLRWGGGGRRTSGVCVKKVLVYGCM